MLTYVLAFWALSAPQSIEIREILAIESLGSRGRVPIHADRLEAALVIGKSLTFRPGATLDSIDGETRTWTTFEADEEGWFGGPAFSGGFAHAALDVPTSGAWRLDASGHAAVRVDGTLHAGDVYQLGITRVPLALEAGPHEFLFRGGRGRLRARLEPAPAEIYLESVDRTLPDVIRGAGGHLWLGIIVANASPDTARDLTVVTTASDGPPTETPIFALHESSYRKVPVRVEVPSSPLRETVTVELELRSAANELLHRDQFDLSVRSPTETHARTFISDIDGSVQYYSVVPPAGETPSGDLPALVLSLHGASVEARNQAAAYRAKPGTYIVCPTNRRPFGFDWEDWGRLDALEVLELAEERYATDPRRTYLTGHSMGGHGTWQLGALFAGRFAAIAPSAGWRDFRTYGRSTEEQPWTADPVGALLDRATNTSRTLEHKDNYRNGGVYVLHGDADNNVPVSEARAMRTSLAEFHPNFAYYERPGAGHWWGNECVDWPPLFDFLFDNALPAPEDVLEIDFTTANSHVSNTCHWIALGIQRNVLEPSRVIARLDPDARTLDLTLDNVERATLDLSRFVRQNADGDSKLRPGETLTLRSGERSLEIEIPEEPAQIVVGFGEGGELRISNPLGPWYKDAHRSGPFKLAFQNRMVFVYGTHGNDEENHWAFSKARYDHETWRYRGNGSVDVVADRDFAPDFYADRNVILYGNSDTNTAWSLVLGNAFDVRRDHIRVGEQKLDGDDLALLAIYPRRGSDIASVGVVAGTGLAGSRTLDEIPYFVSGVGYPDWTILSAKTWSEGISGVRAGGYFRTDWSPLEGADEVWRKE